MKNEPKSSPIPQTHTSYHNSGNVNKDYIGNSGRASNNNIYNNNGKPTTSKLETSDGKTIKK